MSTRHMSHVTVVTAVLGERSYFFCGPIAARRVTAMDGAFAVQVVIDCESPHVLADWWAATLGWAVEPQDESFIRSMIAQGHASDAETTTHNGALVWAAGAAVCAPEKSDGQPRRGGWRIAGPTHLGHLHGPRRQRVLRRRVRAARTALALFNVGQGSCPRLRPALSRVGGETLGSCHWSERGRRRLSTVRQR